MQNTFSGNPSTPPQRGGESVELASLGPLDSGAHHQRSTSFDQPPSSTRSRSGTKQRAGEHLDTFHEQTQESGEHGSKLGTLEGVFIPTCENMWGVLIFLRFNFIVGHAGLLEGYLVIFLSFSVALFTALSMSAVATNGPARKGGVYTLITRALGHELGGAVGCVYFLALSFLACLEMVGACEAFFMIYPDMKFAGAPQIYGLVLSAATALTIVLFAHQIHQISFLFAIIVGWSLFSVYGGILASPTDTEASKGMITGAIIPENETRRVLFFFLLASGNPELSPAQGSTNAELAGRQG